LIQDTYLVLSLTLKVLYDVLDDKEILMYQKMKTDIKLVHLLLLHI